MSRAPLVTLGIDVGTTSTKAVLVGVDEDGAVEELAVATTPTPQSAPALLDAVRRTVAAVLEQHPGRPEAVGVASMAETGVPLGADGSPLTGLLRWDGRRAGAQAASLARAHGAGELFAATGVRPSAKVPLATWAWLRDQGVAMHRWAGAADLVVLALTGRLVTDHTLAGRTMAYRVTAPGGGVPDGFDPDLLALVGLGPDGVPAVAAPDAVAGRVDRPSAAAAGLAGVIGDDGIAPGTPVVVAGHDHAVGAWAAGVRHPGDRADSLGTAEAVLTVLAAAPDPTPVAAAGMSWVRTVSGRHHALLAGSASAGAMLGWLERRLAGASLAGALDAAALDLLRRPEPTGLVVLPYLTGRQTPHPDPDATVRVVAPGGAEADPVRLTRAVLEGICLQARWMLEEQARLGDVPAPGTLRVLGGPALSVAAWAETKRRVTPERQVRVTSGEPVAVGAGLLGAVRAGLLGDVPTLLEGAPTLAAEPVETTGGRPGEPHPYDAMLADLILAATTTTPQTVPGGPA